MLRKPKVTKRRGAVLLILVIVLSFGFIDSRFLLTGWSPDTGGLCFISQRHDSNANSSYSVFFLGVNFTFLYWTYPPPAEGPNGTTFIVVDAPYTAYFRLTFDDGSHEILSIYVGGYAVLSPFQIPRGVRSTHMRPTAGVIAGESWGLWGGWQYTVAPFV